MLFLLVVHLLIDFFLQIIIYLERGEGREKEGKKHQFVRDTWLPHTYPQMETWPGIQACTLTGNQTGDLLVRSLALNPLSHTSQGHWLILVCALTGD